MCDVLITNVCVDLSVHFFSMRRHASLEMERHSQTWSSDVAPTLRDVPGTIWVNNILRKSKGVRIILCHQTQMSLTWLWKKQKTKQTTYMKPADVMYAREQNTFVDKKFWLWSQIWPWRSKSPPPPPKNKTKQNKKKTGILNKVF